MYKVKLELETITPMFMYGATGNPELRSSEFKGMMRFWWRAAYSGNDIGEMRKRESEIFGSTEGKSKVKITVKGYIKEISEYLKAHYKLSWNFRNNERRLVNKHRGVGYLFYSIIQGKKKFFDVNQKFEIIFQSENLDSLNNSLAAFWLSVVLGGFGSRARRGGGNLNVKNVISNEKTLEVWKNAFKISASNIEGFEKWFKKGLTKAREIINENKDTTVMSYSTLNGARILLSQEGFKKWYEALAKIGNKYADFRYDNKRNVIDTAIFGLPRPHVKVGDNSINRRSSPLIMKIIKLPKPSPYHWMAIRLGGDFLPESIGLYKETKENKKKELEEDNKKLEAPTWKLMNEFWAKLKNESIKEISLKGGLNEKP